MKKKNNILRKYKAFFKFCEQDLKLTIIEIREGKKKTQEGTRMYNISHSN